MARLNISFPKLKLSQNHRIVFKKILKHTVYVLAVIGGLALVLLLQLGRILGGQQSISVQDVPQNAIITLDLNASFPETPKDSLLAEIDETPMTYFELIKNLNIAVLDDNVKALIAKVNTTKLGLAQIQNLRRVISRFRAQGKAAYIYSSGMGNLGQGTDEYYLASAFGRIYMQPHSDIGITGIYIEVPFIAETLRKLGLAAEFYTRYEYKNAAASLTDSHFSAAYKQQMTILGRSVYNTLKDESAAERKISPSAMAELINQAPLSAEEALQYKLIDGIAYYDDLVKEVENHMKGKTIRLEDYAANFESKQQKLPAIAYLTLDGTIVDGESSDSPLSGEITVGADTIIKNIQTIARNKKVKALILRINSPGGSYTASDAIRHELVKLKQKMPVIISMGDYAASGGYFIALAGDKIIAEPLTLTGSIGVLGGKIAANGLWKKLGVNWGQIQFGKNAGILSLNHKFSAGEKAAFNKSLNNIYQDFTQKVSAARKIPLKQLDKLARGRVWLGADAVQNGLIDMLGDIDTALLEAKNLANITPTEKFDILVYPKAKTLAEKINDLLRRSPQISINRLASKIGLDIQDINMLQHLQYDSIIAPFTIKK